MISSHARWPVGHPMQWGDLRPRRPYWPVQEPIPEHWQQFGRGPRGSLMGAAVNLFVDDYRLESLWRCGPGALALADAVTLPDFSVAWETPFPVAHFQWYRAAVVGELLAEAGVRVLPVLSFTSDAVADVAPGSVVACRMPPRGADALWLRRWQGRFSACLDVLRPARLVVFGNWFAHAEYCHEVTEGRGIPIDTRALHASRHLRMLAAQNPHKRLHGGA